MAYLGAKFTDNIYICLDSLELTGSLLATTTTSNQQAFSDFTVLAQQRTTRARCPFTKAGKARVRWVPGHTETPGNEEADTHAKGAAEAAASVALRANPPPK